MECPLLEIKPVRGSTRVAYCSAGDTLALLADYETKSNDEPLAVVTLAALDEVDKRLLEFTHAHKDIETTFLDNDVYGKELTSP